MPREEATYYEVVKAGPKNGIRFVLWADGTSQNCVYDFFQGLDIKKEQTPIKAVVAYIDTVYPDWSRVPDTKTNKLDDKLFELKSFQVRIACFIQPGTRTIVGIYGIKKKCQRWPKGDMKIAKRKYNNSKNLDFQDC